MRMASMMALAVAFGTSGCGGGSDTVPGDAGESDARAGDDGGAADAAGTVPTRIERYLRSDAADRLVFEVDAVDGLEPSDDVADQLTSGLADVLDKPGGIEVARDDALDARGADHTWTRDELYAFADDTFSRDAPEGTVEMHVMFIDGQWEDDTDSGATLGLAWGHTHIAIFKQRLEDACAGGLLGSVNEALLCRNAELSILTHEVGHNIGLVNNGLPMEEDHEDAEHPRHDADDACVMYWAYEGEAVVDQLATRIMGGNDEALGFDAACKADIAAVRGG